MRGSSVTSPTARAAGDTIAGSLTPGWVSFQRNYPRHAPMSAVFVRRIVNTLEPDNYDPLYTLGGGAIDATQNKLSTPPANRHVLGQR
jgi:hypothetical protein